tara:strand:- start:674 stop:1099 length:426 start_codon:yes stop_codon:yes gene_type:complete
MADLQAVKKEFRKRLHDLVEQELETFKPHSGAQTIFEDLEYDGRLHQTIDDTVAYMSYQELREVFGSDYAHELELPEWVEVNDEESRSLIKLVQLALFGVLENVAQEWISETQGHIGLVDAENKRAYDAKVLFAMKKSELA